MKKTLYSLRTLFMLYIPITACVVNCGIRVPAVKTIHEYAEEGRIDEINDLLVDGAVIDATDLDGKTALHIAVANGDLKLVKFLLSRGANVNIKNRVTGETPVDLAAKFVMALPMNRIRNDIVMELLKYGKMTPRISVMLGNKEWLSEYVKSGGRFEWSSQDQCLLNLAAYSGNMEIVKFLLENGALVNCKSTDGNTPLHNAVARRDISLIEFLLERGADANAQDKNGKTPLHLAAQADELEIARILLRAGARTDLKTTNGATPIDMTRHREEFQAILAKREELTQETGATNSVRPSIEGSIPSATY